MNILVIDTATGIEVIAAMSGEKSADHSEQVNVSHSKTLMSGIDRVLKDTGMNINEINLIGAGIGPGSFTGIRIAVTTARMISQIRRIPAAGINTQMFYAYSALEESDTGDKILVAFDAKKGKVFGALYQSIGRNEIPVELIKPGDYEIGSITKKIIPEEKIILLGDGCKKYYSEISESVPRNQFIENYIPSGKRICELTEKIYKKNPEFFEDYSKLLPSYSRKSDAEVLKEKQSSKTV